MKKDLTLDTLEQAKALIKNNVPMCPDICFVTSLFLKVGAVQFQVKNKYYLAIDQGTFEKIKDESGEAARPNDQACLLSNVYGMRVVYDDSQLKELFAQSMSNIKN